MTSPVIFVTPNQAVDECMEIMTRKRIRHLPIVENEKMLGVVSIGDQVKWVVSEQEETIEHLQNYISSKYPTWYLCLRAVSGQKFSSRRRTRDPLVRIADRTSASLEIQAGGSLAGKDSIEASSTMSSS